MKHTKTIFEKPQAGYPASIVSHLKEAIAELDSMASIKCLQEALNECEKKWFQEAGLLAQRLVEILQEIVSSEEG